MNINTKTYSLTDLTEVVLDKQYPYVYIKNFANSDIYVSEKANFQPGEVNVTRIPAGTVGLIYRESKISKLYAIPSTDTDGNIEVIGAYDSNLSFFKGSSGGGGASTAGVGKDVTGETFTIAGTAMTAGTGAEIFNAYNNNKAAGHFSHAEGLNTVAMGHSSHSEGISTEASGDHSHSEGNGTKATGYHAHAEGVTSKATGSASHAEGNGTVASENNAHSEGFQTKAAGENSHAEGKNSEATGDISHAEGYGCTASGSCSHAEGQGTKAVGVNAHAEGYQTIAASSNQHVQGRLNVADTSEKYAFIIGNGTGSTRSDAFKVDWNGLIYVGNSSTGIDVSALLTQINEILTRLDSTET